MQLRQKELVLRARSPFQPDAVPAIGYTVASEGKALLATVRDAGHRQLPFRYQTDVWDRRLRERLMSIMMPGVAILDIGAGRSPTVPPADRPPSTWYVGLDPNATELERARVGSYDDIVVTPGEKWQPALEGRFDLVVSFFALEHVRSTAAVLRNARAYLRPGGWLLAQFAGKWSPFSSANRFLPASVSRVLLMHLRGREPESIFPAHYDRCTYSEIDELLSGWSSHEVAPLFTGAPYVLFSRVLTAAYVGYEEWAYRRGHRDLAPYYLATAMK
jgi:SAM-dependent methyltransferase